MNNTFRPTYLYIKQHTITGKLYFGMTTKSDPIKYLGSGKHWKAHIKLHGEEHVVTLWYFQFTDQKECIEFALEFSGKMDIVRSKDWANLIEENGIGGGERNYTPEECAERSAKMMGKKNGLGSKHTREWCENMIGNKYSKGFKNVLYFKHPRVICPHCKLEGGSNSMKRYHFDNCKKNPG